MLPLTIRSVSISDRIVNGNIEGSYIFTVDGEYWQVVEAVNEIVEMIKCCDS